jgi:hypothetical protein
MWLSQAQATARCLQQQLGMTQKAWACQLLLPRRLQQRRREQRLLRLARFCPAAAAAARECWYQQLL